MEFLDITSKIAAVLAIQMLFLTMLVSMRRVALGKSEGDIAKYPYQDGNDESLKRRIRAFGNFIEYVPMCLIMLALIEFNGASEKLLWGLGVFLIIGRISHSVGMLSNPHFPVPRIIGMFASYAALIVPAIWLLTK
tara:strand:- start:227 stop:634 length:408 start_codon:yes stop_codon:yes gene_type:complete